MKRLWPVLIVLIALVFSIALWLSLTKEKDAALAGRSKVTVQLQWTPGAQFIGFYVAKAKSFYAEEGLSVDFQHGGPEVNPIRNVVDRQAQIGLATGDQVLIWADKSTSNDNLRVVGTVFNTSIAAFMSKAAINITEPRDLVGKTVGVYPTYDTENLLLCMLRHEGLSLNALKIVQFPTLPQFEDGTVQVFPSYIINEPVWAKQQNIKYNLLLPERSGIQFYSDTIFTRQDYLLDNRDVVKKFLRASSKGWSYAKQNPDEAISLMYEVVRGSLGEGLPRERQLAMMQEAVKHIGAGPRQLNFAMEKSRWENMQTELQGIGKVSPKSRVDQLCDFEIVDEAMR